MKTKKNKLCKLPSLQIINGSKIYFYHIPNKTIHLSAMIIGAKHKENKNNCGISHLLEHVLINAYNQCNYLQCKPYLDKIGAQYNAHTSNNYIQYWIAGLSSDKYTLLDYLINIINYPVFKQNNIEYEKHAVKSEIITIINNKYYKMNEYFSSQYFKHQALKYNNNLTQQLENLSKITIHDLKSWYEKEYNNIIYFVIGDFIQKDISNYFKSNTPLKTPSIPSFNYNQLLSFKKQILYFNKKTQKMVYFLIAFPLKITFSNPYFIYLNTLCSLLETILVIKLRTELHLIYNIKIYPSINLTSISIYINIDVTTDKALTVINYLFNFLNSFKKNDFFKEYFNGYKKKKKYILENLSSNNSNNKIFSEFNNQLFYKIYSPEYKLINNCELNNMIQKIDYLFFKKFIKLYLDFNSVFISYQSPIKII